MIVSNLFPGDVLQFYDLLQDGYWHARSASFGHGPRMHMLEWARLPGDFIFITVGVPLVIAAFKTEIDFRALEVGRRIRPLPQLTLADGFPGTQTLELVARGRTTRRRRFFH